MTRDVNKPVHEPKFFMSWTQFMICKLQFMLSHLPWITLEPPFSPQGFVQFVGHTCWSQWISCQGNGGGCVCQLLQLICNLGNTNNSPPKFDQQLRLTTRAPILLYENRMDIYPQLTHAAFTLLTCSTNIYKPHQIWKAGRGTSLNSVLWVWCL